ncbi:MAG TPA: hypothetical protein VLV50_12590 [Stellaceae bacterium]|nr:hypothetical protein [Stellaceae bacterium]
MTVQQPAHGTASGTMEPLVVITILALVLNLAITWLSATGHNIVFPINILGGFSFNVAPLLPAATALIIAFGLWRYAGLSQGRAWLAALFIFIAPIVLVQIWNALTGLLLNLLPDSVVTNSQNFYGIFFVQRAVSAASVIVVMAIASPIFRAWSAWLWLIVIWAGGDTLLFGLYRNAVMTREVYLWIYPFERVLGFIVIAWYLQRSARRHA